MSKCPVHRSAEGSAGMKQIEVDGVLVTFYKLEAEDLWEHIRMELLRGDSAEVTVHYGGHYVSVRLTTAYPRYDSGVIPSPTSDRAAVIVTRSVHWEGTPEFRETL